MDSPTTPDLARTVLGALVKSLIMSQWTVARSDGCQTVQQSIAGLATRLETHFITLRVNICPAEQPSNPPIEKFNNVAIIRFLHYVHENQQLFREQLLILMNIMLTIATGGPGDPGPVDRPQQQPDHNQYLSMMLLETLVKEEIAQTKINNYP